MMALFTTRIAPVTSTATRREAVTFAAGVLAGLVAPATAHLPSRAAMTEPNYPPPNKGMTEYLCNIGAAFYEARRDGLDARMTVVVSEEVAGCLAEGAFKRIAEIRNDGSRVWEVSACRFATPREVKEMRSRGFAPSVTSKEVDDALELLFEALDEATLPAKLRDAAELLRRASPRLITNA